jgi:hypothetical protein
MILAHLDFRTMEAAHVGIGSRHRLNLHQASWEYYVVLEGMKTLQVEDELVTIEAGEMLEVPPSVRHTIRCHQAPYQGFTPRVPILAHDDKVEYWEEMRCPPRQVTGSSIGRSSAHSDPSAAPPIPAMDTPAGSPTPGNPRPLSPRTMLLAGPARSAGMSCGRRWSPPKAPEGQEYPVVRSPPANRQRPVGGLSPETVWQDRFRYIQIQPLYDQSQNQ